MKENSFQTEACAHVSFTLFSFNGRLYCKIISCTTSLKTVVFESCDRRCFGKSRMYRTAKTLRACEVGCILTSRIYLILSVSGLDRSGTHN